MVPALEETGTYPNGKTTLCHAVTLRDTMLEARVMCHSMGTPGEGVQYGVCLFVVCLSGEFSIFFKSEIYRILGE